MDHQHDSRSARGMRQALRRVLALFGLAALAGSALAAPTPVDLERAALDARVAQVRAAWLVSQAQAEPPKKLPWGNWGNWNNWPNWANWLNR